ncbi:nuclear transport factor 2 family protein [Mucilaginibacter sp.]|uniref:nuclear transport factor 2 family protein n=1 Tax=Mucilaginibacter sp. TaxID=1882438 RepID=UPI0025CDBB04|nr:nuclear transport factor 2 family protein [Mucilaginibacter sp.]
MQSLHKQIALAFSGGNFEFCYEHLADDITFNIVGNEIVSGKDAVIDFCNKTAQYFTTLTTKFELDNVIVDENCVAINGTAEFYVEDRVNYISSCDVYKFVDGKLKEITSYCISTKKIG